MSDDPVTVERYRFLPEAEAARMHLEAEGLTAFLADAELVSMDWLMANAVGYIKLQVPGNQAERALALLAQQRAERALRGDDEGETDSTACLSCGAQMPDDASPCPACGWSYTEPEESS